MKGKKLRAVGAYVFAGGFSLGVREHFDVAAVLEENGYGAETAVRNLGLPTHVGPRNWPIGELLDGPRVDFVYGNPPCAAWSPLGKRIQSGRESWHSDERVECTRIHFNLLETLQPTVWAWESVPQAFTAGKPFVRELTARAGQLGYHAYHVLHNAKYIFGRQQRKRFFCVFSKVAIDWRCPFVEPIPMSQSLRDYAKVKKEYSNEVTHMGMSRAVWKEAASTRSSMRDAWEVVAARVGAGKAGNRAAFSNSIAHLDKPCPTVLGFSTLHPTEFRFLSLGEMLFCSGYPPSWELTPSSLGAKGGEIARGVLPPVGAWLAENVARAVRAGEPAAAARVTVVDFTRPPGAIYEED
jgi:site-specific DNA-cytosine methylase